MYRVQRGKRRETRSLSLIKLPSQGSCVAQELLVLVLLHLGLSPSLGTDGVHRAVVAQTLDIGGSLLLRNVDEFLVLCGAGGISDERGGVGLVCLAAGGVRGLVDGQDGRVRVLLGGGFRLARIGGFLGLVEGHWRRRRVEWAEALGEFVDGELDIGHVHGVVRLHVHFELSAEVVVLARGVLHRLDGGRQREHHILLLGLGRFLRGKDRVERLLVRGRGHGRRDGDGTVDREERRYMHIYALVSKIFFVPLIPSQITHHAAADTASTAHSATSKTPHHAAAAEQTAVPSPLSDSFSPPAYSPQHHHSHPSQASAPTTTEPTHQTHH